MSDKPALLGGETLFSEKLPIIQPTLPPLRVVGPAGGGDLCYRNADQGQVSTPV